MKRLVFIILLLSTAAQADIKVMGDGEQLIWSNNSQTVSISASSSMSASVDYLWPVADAVSGGQALLSDGSGLLSWGTPTTSTAHNILSGTHDATTNAVTRGSIIYGNSTPKWDELVIGSSGTILRSDGTDVVWSATTNITALGTIVTGTWNATAIDISSYTNLTVTGPITLTDDTVGITIAKDIVAGTGLSGGEDNVLPGADADTTLTFDATELDAIIWSDGVNASNAWTFNVSGTDHTMTAGSAKMTFSNEVEAEQLSSTDDATIADNTNTGSLYAGAAGDRVEIDAVGDVDFIGQSGLAFGEISVESNAVETTISTQDVPVQVTVFDTARHSNNTTISIANSDITILQAGHYLVTVSAAVNSVAGLGSKLELKCRVNNGSFDAIPHADRNLGGGAAEAGSITLSGIADLDTGDTIEIWIINETNTANYVVEDISMALVQIGGPIRDTMIYEDGDTMIYENGDTMAYNM